MSLIPDNKDIDKAHIACYNIKNEVYCKTGWFGWIITNSKRYSRYGCKHRFRYPYFDYSLMGVSNYVR